MKGFDIGDLRLGEQVLIVNDEYEYVGYGKITQLSALADEPGAVVELDHQDKEKFLIGSDNPEGNLMVLKVVGDWCAA